jgi:hypothetical protein
MDALDQFFQQFLRERTCLHNITPKTRQWYQNVWSVFLSVADARASQSPSADLITRIDQHHGNTFTC